MEKLLEQKAIFKGDFFKFILFPFMQTYARDIRPQIASEIMYNFNPIYRCNKCSSLQKVICLFRNLCLSHVQDWNYSLWM